MSADNFQSPLAQADKNFNAEAREALAAWLAESGQRFPNQDQTAYFLTRMASDCRSAQSNPVRRSHNLVLVAEIAGHKRIENHPAL